MEETCNFRHAFVVADVQDNPVNRMLFFNRCRDLVPAIVRRGALLGEWSCLQALLCGSASSKGFELPDDVVSVCRQVCMTVLFEGSQGSLGVLAVLPTTGSLGVLAVLPTKALLAVVDGKGFQTKVLKRPTVAPTFSFHDGLRPEGITRISRWAAEWKESWKKSWSDSTNSWSLYNLAKVLFRLWKESEGDFRVNLQEVFSATDLRQCLDCHDCMDKSKDSTPWLQLFNTLCDMVSSRALTVGVIGDGQQWQGIMTDALDAARAILMRPSNEFAVEGRLNFSDLEHIAIRRETHVCVGL
jgi:hypothetical protein